MLRLTEQTERIVHVPDVLYHWRLVPDSTAAGVAAKPHAHAAGLRACKSTSTAPAGRGEPRSGRRPG